MRRSRIVLSRRERERIGRNWFVVTVTSPSAIVSVHARSVLADSSR